MAKSSVVKLPNGVSIEISPDMTPDQITALISAVTGNALPIVGTPEISKSGQSSEYERSAEDIWNSSKRERVALFIRNYFSETLWFNAKMVQDQQLAETGKLALGETSAIGTYLTRLFEDGNLDRKVNGRKVFYRLNDQLLASYPEITVQQLESFIVQ
ncbi:MAG: hypothetical protein IH840_09150 [Candidatus Heimdallarchaeota archaeon]|nr:hypothetical protein [Candidatus Heimdallarchaeota archaeon]